MANFNGFIQRLIPKTCLDSKGSSRSIATEMIKNTNDPIISILLV